MKMSFGVETWKRCWIHISGSFFSRPKSGLISLFTSCWYWNIISAVKHWTWTLKAASNLARQAGSAVSYLDELYYHDYHCQLIVGLLKHFLSPVSMGFSERGCNAGGCSCSLPTNTTGSERDVLSGWVENTRGWGQMGTGCGLALLSRMIPTSEGQDIAPCLLAGSAFTHFPVWEVVVTAKANDWPILLY